MSLLRSYSDLLTLTTFEERFNYLKLDGKVGSDTFGFDRFINQQFYRSNEWKRIRNQVILRDNGCDLGIEDHPIYGRIIIHHINPVTIKELIDSDEFLFNPANLICVSHDTHNALHYGDETFLKKNEITTRLPNDTILWKRGE